MMSHSLIKKKYDVAIVGGGPAGLSAAIELKLSGVNEVVVLERNSQAGGNPRHCGHSPFGMREFKRIYYGPKYAKKLVDEAIESGVKILLNTSVISFEKGGLLTLSTEQGVSQIQAKRVVLSTGIREKPRSARLISGQRPLGIMTAGALQSLVYLSDGKPFEKPVIIGSELVSFSAIATCRHANIKPVAMIEENSRPTAWSLLRLYPYIQGISFLKNTQLLEIHGKEVVTGVSILTDKGEKKHIDCDGVIFTGQFVPEASLVRMNHLMIDQYSNGPIVDQFNRCSDRDYFAIGNVLRPVETAGWCWQEGVDTAKSVLKSLDNSLEDIKQISISVQSPVIKYCVPQKISVQSRMKEIQLQLRFTEPAKGRIIIYTKNKELLSKQVNGLPERRILIFLSREITETMALAGENLFIRFQKEGDK